ELPRAGLCERQVCRRRRYDAGPRRAAAAEVIRYTVMDTVHRHAPPPLSATPRMTVARSSGLFDHGVMRLRKSVLHGVLAAAIALPLIVRPAPAKASDVAEAAPFMIFAAAFTVTIIIIAINNPVTDSTKTSASPPPATSSSSSKMVRAPGTIPIAGF